MTQTTKHTESPQLGSNPGGHERISPEEITRLRRFLTEWRGTKTGLHPVLSSRLPMLSGAGVFASMVLGLICESLAPGSFLIGMSAAAGAYLMTVGVVLAQRIRKLNAELQAILPSIQEQLAPVAFKGNTIQSSLTAVSSEQDIKKETARSLAEIAFHLMDTNTATKH